MKRPVSYAILSGLAVSMFLNVYFAVSLVKFADDLGRVKRVIATRELADPLAPSECSYEEGLGETKDHPCRITFERLLGAPQKFHDRWIMVSGTYTSGMEMSALHALAYRSKPRTDPLEGAESAVWLDVSSEGLSTFHEHLTVVGKFRNGPAGHMSAYFGRILDGAVLSR